MSRFSSLLVAVAVGAAAVLVIAAPAAAHDELIASSPAPNAQLSEAPAGISLTFSADVLTLGAAVIVADGSGRDWVAGAPTVSSGTVTVELEAGMPANGYEIRWRVVSADGHPISGLVPFTVGGGAPLVRTPAAAAPTTTDSPDTVQEQNSQEDQGVLRILLVGAGGAVVAAAAYALIHIIRRKKGTPQ